MPRVRAERTLADREKAVLREQWMVPHPERFDATDPNAALILVAHDTACERGEAGYLDPYTGLFVMTAAFHADRGTCCDSGCRHCPYLPDSTADDQIP